MLTGWVMNLLSDEPHASSEPPVDDRLTEVALNEEPGEQTRPPYYI